MTNKTPNRPSGIYLPLAFHLIDKISKNKNVSWSVLSKELSITTSYVLLHKELFLKHGLISIDKIGRCSLINLTLKGKKLAESINLIATQFGGIDKLLPSISRKNGKNFN